MSKRKYQKGKLITSLDELARQDFIYVGNQVRPVNCGWFMSWQFRMVNDCVQKGLVWKAERVKSDGLQL